MEKVAVALNNSIAVAAAYTNVDVYQLTEDSDGKVGEGKSFGFCFNSAPLQLFK